MDLYARHGPSFSWSFFGSVPIKFEIRARQQLEQSARVVDVFTRLKLMGVLRDTRRCWHFISALRREEEHVEFFARQT